MYRKWLYDNVMWDASLLLSVQKSITVPLSLKHIKPHNISYILKVLLTWFWLNLFRSFLYFFSFHPQESSLLVHFAAVLTYNAGTLAPKLSPTRQSTQAQFVMCIHSELMHTFHLWEPGVYCGARKRNPAVSSSRWPRAVLDRHHYKNHKAAVALKEAEKAGLEQKKWLREELAWAT